MTMIKSAFLRTSALAALVALSTSVQAHAQSAPPTPATEGGLAGASARSNDNVMSEIVVTARRHEESLQSVPLAVTALPMVALERNNIVKMDDLQRVTPAINVSQGIKGSTSPSFMIRGLRTFDLNYVSDPSITIYVDEVGLAHPVGTSQLLFDLSSVQVLKGPQGTLFGRNTVGGAILVTTQAPTQEFEGYARALLGSYNWHELEGVVNVPINDTLALRIGGKYSKRRGYLTNVVTGEHLDDLGDGAIRTSLLWEPTAEISSTTTASFFRNRSNGNTVKIDQVAVAGVPAAFRPILAPNLLGDLASAKALGKYELQSRIPDFITRTQVLQFQNSTQVKLSPSVLLKNIFGKVNTRDLYTVDGDGALSSTIDYIAYIRARQISDEIQLQAEMGNLSLILGGFYFTEKANEYSDSRTFTTILAPAVPFPALNNYVARNESYAGFVHAELKLPSIMEGLSLSGGMRLTHDTRRLTGRTRSITVNPATSALNYVCLADGTVNTSIDPALCGKELSRSFSEPTWDVTLSAQLNPDTLVYLAHRHGYKAGGLNSRPTATTGLVPFAPEKVNDVEFGLKMDFDLGAVPARLNVAAYHTWLSGAQRTQNTLLSIGGVPSLSTQIVNAADARIYGGEVELSIKPTRNIEISAGYGLIKPSYSRFNDFINIAGVVTAIDISDSRFSYVPKHTLTGSVRYEFPLDENVGRVALQANAYYQTKFYASDINTANCGPGGAYLGCLGNAGTLPGYAIFGLRAEWSRPFGGKFDLSAFVDNVTDKFYRTSSLVSLSTLGLSNSNIGAPRMYGVAVKVPFGGGQ